LERFIDLWALAAVVCGIGYIGWVFYKQLLVSKSQHWPAVDGTIINASLGKQSSQTGPGRTTNRTYAARINYRYMVGSRVYSNNIICIGGELNSSFKGRAEERLAKFPEGTTVPVYYDPANPARSCLERRGEIALFGYAIGSAITLFGLLILLDVINFGR